MTVAKFAEFLEDYLRRYPEVSSYEVVEFFKGPMEYPDTLRAIRPSLKVNSKLRLVEFVYKLEDDIYGIEDHPLVAKHKGTNRDYFDQDNWSGGL